ncbi:GyrI-like domain-containing protein [Nakamurella sp.]|uniref:GyrI-like domain-containing protein n=1 Tax=Nakamurella sp. TaxID=1869182 RepID=UPI003B3B0877
MAGSDPHVLDRPAVPFVGTTTGITLATIAEIADRIPELVGALVAHGTTPAGAPFFRYLEIHGEAMTVQVGVPVPAGATLPEHVTPFPTEAGELPAGRYVTTTHVGPFDGLLAATASLMAWADDQGLDLDREIADGVEKWAARLEIYLTDPRLETDPARFRTDLAIKVR